MIKNLDISLLEKQILVTLSGEAYKTLRAHLKRAKLTTPPVNFKAYLLWTLVNEELSALNGKHVSGLARAMTSVLDEPVIVWDLMSHGDCLKIIDAIINYQNEVYRNE